MIIEGYAYKSDEKEISNKYSKRFSEIKDKKDNIIKITKKSPMYGHCRYEGEILADNIKRLDIALLCDNNLCFGASCEISHNKTFICKVFTD